MRRVLGVAAVVIILSSASYAAAQEGWGGDTSGGSGESGAGWGQPTDTGSASGSGESGSNWGNSSQPQAADPETPTGGGSSGWGSAPSGGGSSSTATPTPTPTPTPATAAPAEEAGPVGAQFRMQHRAALGAHTHMSGAFMAAFDGLSNFTHLHSNSPWLNLSFMYHINERLTIDIFLGFTIGSLNYASDDAGHEDGDKVTAFELGLGPRLLITLAESDHARFYTGIGMGLIIGLLNGVAADEDDGSCPDGMCGGWDAYGFSMAAPLGVEYRFRRVPNLSMSLELNFHFVFQSIGTRYPDDGDITDITSEAEYNHIVVGLGNPRNSGLNVFDFLSFLTFGFHWLI